METAGLLPLLVGGVLLMTLLAKVPLLIVPLAAFALLALGGVSS